MKRLRAPNMLGRDWTALVVDRTRGATVRNMCGLSRRFAIGLKCAKKFSASLSPQIPGFPCANPPRLRSVL